MFVFSCSQVICWKLNFISVNKIKIENLKIVVRLCNLKVRRKKNLWQDYGNKHCIIELAKHLLDPHTVVDEWLTDEEGIKFSPMIIYPDIYYFLHSIKKKQW